MKEDKPKKIITKKIIAIATIPVIIGTVAFVVVSKKKADTNGASISGYVVGSGIEPDLTPEQIQELLNKEVDKSKIAFSVYSEPVFEGKKGVIMFANPRYSAHNIDLTVTLDGEEIIKTAKISPDQYIEEISLLGKPLKKGKHTANGIIKAYDRETDEYIGEVAVEMIITSK